MDEMARWQSAVKEDDLTRYGMRFTLLKNTRKTGTPRPPEFASSCIDWWHAVPFALLSVLLCLSSGVAHADSLYSAALGSLPQAQGFTYSGDAGNPSPKVSGGLLLENKTISATAQYWNDLSDTSIDFSKSFSIEARLQINSSNFIQNIGDGSSREGYYLFASDKTGVAFSVGLAASGFVINDYPAGTFVSYPIVGGFHTYKLTINNGLAAFSIDGAVLKTGITPEPFGQVLSESLFGAAAGASISNTALSYFCTSDSGSACAPSTTTATPEPTSLVLLLTGLLAAAKLPNGYRRYGCLSRSSS
jgi:hypothetical protein